ncbi:MAG: tRNA pseudouridine(55) synthase TruB [Chloroflexi bacterium]|nr:tRNA pseudouridine(55) synthase TruB [Chloroflexota bacterium]
MSEQEVNLKDTVSGVLVIDKPVGMTSHAVVQVVRQGTGIRRAGHTGTLDPRASGVLVVLVGPAVRLSEYVSASDKRYQAIIRLGETTDTYDGDGEVVTRRPVDITTEQIEEALTHFEGTVEQTPPAYSAKRVQGKKAYELAREGEAVELEPKEIDVYHLELLEWDPPEAIIDVFCSSGTYVRSLSNDLGELLGCGGHLVGLRRTKSGEFALRDAIQLRKLEEAFETGDWYKYLIPAAEALADWPSRELTNEEVDLVRHGHRIPVEKAPENPERWIRAISQQGELVALMEYAPEEKEWQPRKVFFS